MKRLYAFFSSLVLSALVLVSCTDSYRNLKLTSFSLESIAPHSSKNIEAVASIGIDNPSKAFTVVSVEGVVKTGAQDLLYFYSDEKTQVEGNCLKSYSVPFVGSLADGISLLSLLGSVGADGRDAFKADVKVKVKFKSGFGKTLEYTDLPL